MFAHDCILASSDKFGHRLRSADVDTCVVSADVDTCVVSRTRTGFGDLPASRSGTAYRRICGGQTLAWRIPSITEDISVRLGTAETAAH